MLKTEREFCFVKLAADGSLEKVSDAPFPGAAKMAEADFIVLRESLSVAAQKTPKELEAAILADWQKDKSALNELKTAEALYRLRGLSDKDVTIAVIAAKFGDESVWQKLATVRAEVHALMGIV